MADNLTIKVSEAEYRETLSRLENSVSGLQEQLGKLREARGKLEQNFVSKLLSADLRDLITTKEREVEGSIESIQTQINQINNLSPFSEKCV